jgi:phenylalanyl-tRNA synthetase beta chain
MAIVKFPRKEFEKIVKLTPLTIEKISQFGTPLESLTNDEIEIEIFPNRPDLLSMQGYLRSFNAFLGKETGLKTYKLKKPEKNYKVTISPSVKSVRPYTVCAIVKNLSFNDEKIKEIIDLQEKLHTTLGRNRKKVAIGIYPLEKIKLPIKYMALPPNEIKFIPLESGKEMTGYQILQKYPAGKEFANILEGKEKFPVFIDANKKVLSMPPIINSHETGKVTTSTKDIFIECSGFDLQALNKALNIIITTLADLSPSVSIHQMQLIHKKKSLSPNLSTEKLSISLENANRLLGLNLKESDLERLLPKMGYNYEKGKVEIPAWRSDILHEVDIIEDIAIAYGFQNFIPEIPNISTTASESIESKIKSKLSELLIGLGLIEISTYHLIKQGEAILAKIPNLIELEDSKTDYKYLRPNLLIPTLRILTENKDNEYPQKTFEIGTIFEKSPSTETTIKETQNLIIASSPTNFTEIKQILDYLTKILDIKYTLRESTHPNLIEGRTAEIQINNKLIGYIGELHPKTLHTWNIPLPVAVLEITLEEIFNILKN